MDIRNITIKEWQQFQSVNIQFNSRATIITGGNGSGKTTILKILAQHCGWYSPSLATPKADAVSGIVRYVLRYFAKKDKSSENSIGSVEYSNGVISQLLVNGGGAAQYQVGIPNMQDIHSFYIPSHRAVFTYQQLENIPTSKKNKQSAFQEVSSNNMERYQGGYGPSSSFFMKNILIGWAIHGYGVKAEEKIVMPKDSEQIQHFEGFQDVLRKILPESIGFECIEIRSMEVVFVCNGGEDEFVLEGASGGISALIDIAWQIYMFSTKEKSTFTVFIDELENHLHPIMQRRILPDLVNAFPHAKFVISTHSPLVVGSLKDSSVYALKRNAKGKVESHLLDLTREAKNALEILDEILGVSFTMPIWVEEQLSSIVETHSKNLDDPEVFSKMRKSLSDVGLEKMLPHAIEISLGGRG